MSTHNDNNYLTDLNSKTEVKELIIEYYYLVKDFKTITYLMSKEERFERFRLLNIDSIDIVLNTNNLNFMFKLTEIE